jgi:hypothetical protein
VLGNRELLWVVLGQITPEDVRVESDHDVLVHVVVGDVLPPPPMICSIQARRSSHLRSFLSLSAGFLELLAFPSVLRSRTIAA